MFEPLDEDGSAATVASRKKWRILWAIIGVVAVALLVVSFM